MAKLLDNNLVRLALFLLGAYAVYLLFFNNKPVSNESTLSLDEQQQEFLNNRGFLNSREAREQLAQSSPAVSPPNSCPSIARIGMPDKVLNSQVQSVDDPLCDYQLLKNNVNVLPYPQLSNNYAPQIDVNQQLTNSYNHEQVRLDCFPKDQLSAIDLLPREDGYNTWQEVNPQAQGHLTDQNFLEAGHHYGINTVGQSLKNANMQLRSDPVIPQVAVGPWMQSTYEPDTNRRFFEIGQC